MPLYEDFWGDLDGYWEVCRPKLKNHDHSAMDSHLKVAVRCRPLDARERALKDRSVVTPHADGTVTLDLTRIAQGLESATFAYDHVYGPDVSQREVFETIGYDAVEHAFVGYNVSLFAYGQTSSGKTFSMMGLPSCEDVGLIPRICRTIFHFVALARDEYERYEASIEASYLEVYNEKPRDLLVDPSHSPALQVRESPEVGVFVEGLSRHKTDTAHDVELLINSGTKYRTIAATKYNRESSRSHAVFELTLTQVYKEHNSQLTMQKRSKVNLIDLAGSERTGAIGNKGVVFEEGASINKSLTVLGRCIKALAKLKRSGTANKSLPVPFRESVLTWYLRESLAGNAKTTMLANISPAVSNGTETYGTLRYAAEAKRIETSVHMNEDPIQRQLRQQAEEITKLRHQLAELEQARPGVGGSGTSSMAAMERETLLSALEELRRSSWDAVRSSARFSVEELKPGGAQQDEYPLLVALTPDPMLSGKLKYSVRRLKDGAPVPFGIGRSARNSLELDGVGICQEHCEIAKLPKGAEGEGGAEFGLRVFADAKVHLNGELIEGAPGKRPKLRRAAMQDHPTDIATLATPLTPLHHGDRLILGPCRFVAIFVAFDPASSSDGLDGEENAAARQQRLVGATANWEYSAVVAEMMRRVGRIPRLFGSTDASAEGRLWEDLLRGLDLANQANEIAAEMLVNVEFSVTMTTPLPPHFDETRMHELPALGAQVVVHCRTTLPATATDDRRGRASPSPPSSLHGDSAPYGSPAALRRSGSGRAQSRDSDADFFSLPSESQPRLFDVSLDVFVDFLAGLHDLFGTTALLCQALHADEDASSSASVQSPGSETALSSPKSSASRGRLPWLKDEKVPWLQGAVLRDVFEAADVDGDGLISFNELYGAMVGALGLDVRADALKPVFDAFELAATTFMALKEFVDFLVTYLRIKFGGAIAHLVTNAKAFADYLGVTTGRSANLQRCALVAQAIASDASTEDGRRMPLAALAAHGYYSSSGDGLVRAHALVLPGLVLPRREPSTSAPAEALEIDAEARHLLSVSLARLFDCPPGSVLLRHDNSSDLGPNATSEATAAGTSTVTAAVSGLGDAVVGRALAALVNGDLRSASDTASEAQAYEAQLAERDAKIKELEASLATGARATDEVAVLRSLVDALQNAGKPEGLSPTAEKVWASMSATALLLEHLRQDINKKTAAAASGAPPPMGAIKYPRAPDAKLREAVVKLAELLEVANARVVRAIDDEARMKEASKRLEVKVAQIVSKATSKTSTNSSAEHIDCLRQLVDARKQLAAMAKDNSAGRMARATAQELSLEDDLKDTLAEVQDLEAKVQREGGSESPRLAAQLEKASDTAARLREEVDKLSARNKKLAEAVEERRETIARAISDAEGRLKVASRQAVSAEVKSDEGGALKADLASQKLRVTALKERASHAESSYRGLLESLSSGKWQVVPKGTVTPETAWGPLSGKQPQLRVDTGSPFSYSHTGQSSPTTEERRRDDLDVLAQQEREQSVERRLGESSDLQNQARQLISQSEVRITRIGEIVERLDASSGMLQSLSPDHQSGAGKVDSFSDLQTSPGSRSGSVSHFIFE